MGIEHRPDAFFGFVVQVSWDAFEADVDADDFGGIIGRELAQNNSGRRFTEGLRLRCFVLWLHGIECMCQIQNGMHARGWFGNILGRCICLGKTFDVPGYFFDVVLWLFRLLFLGHFLAPAKNAEHEKTECAVFEAHD